MEKSADSHHARATFQHLLRMEFAAVLEVNDPGEQECCLSDCIRDRSSLRSATASLLPRWAGLSDAYTLQVNKEEVGE